MTQTQRFILCGAILSCGLVAQGALVRLNRTERPLLKGSLASIPLELSDWSGSDLAVASEIVERAQTTEFLSRRYENRKYPGLSVSLWINYSREGTNLRHTPEICLPSGGWTKIESQTRVINVPAGASDTISVTLMSYSQGELVQHIGFWYYIFGEGRLENYVRQLPITSRSSHGQTTRGSSMTVEVFYSGDNTAPAGALEEFIALLAASLDPLLADQRAVYHIP
jgi:EpsI family protein